VRCAAALVRAPVTLSADELADLIDDFRRRANRMLIVCGLAAVVLLIRFAPLLMPGLFGEFSL